MYTASPYPIVWQSPAQLGLTSSWPKIELLQIISRPSIRVPSCQTEYGTGSSVLQSSYKILNKESTTQRTVIKLNTIYLFHFAQDWKNSSSDSNNKTNYWSPLPSGIEVLHPALVGAGEPERPGTKIAEYLQTGTLRLSPCHPPARWAAEELGRQTGWKPGRFPSERCFVSGGISSRSVSQTFQFRQKNILLKFFWSVLQTWAWWSNL